MILHMNCPYFGRVIQTDVRLGKLSSESLRGIGGKREDWVIYVDKIKEIIWDVLGRAVNYCTCKSSIVHVVT